MNENDDGKRDGNGRAEMFADGATTVADAVKEFAIGRTRLYELMSDGKLPFAQLGGRRLIPRRALRRLLAAHLRGTTAQN